MEIVQQQTQLILLRGMNSSRVGFKDKEVVGRFGEIAINDNGKRLIALYKEHRCIITVT